MEFDGSFRLAGSRETLDAVFVVSPGWLRVTAGDYEIGDWPLGEVKISTSGDGVHIMVEGEDLVVRTRDPIGLAEAIREASPPPQHKKRRLVRRQQRRSTPDVPPSLGVVEAEDEPAFDDEPTLDDEPTFEPLAAPSPMARKRKPLAKRFREARDVLEWKRWRKRLRLPTVRWSLAFSAVLTLVLAAVFATETLGMLITLIGMVALVLAALAVSDDPSVYRWLPARVTETLLLAIGIVALGVGLPLIFLG